MWGFDECESVYEKQAKASLDLTTLLPINGRCQEGNFWYSPHRHVVYLEKDTDRVPSAKLFKCPNYIKRSLIGVVHRLSVPIAPVADIEAMFHQVLLKESDVFQLLRWPD